MYLLKIELKLSVSSQGGPELRRVSSEESRRAFVALASRYVIPSAFLGFSYLQNPNTITYTRTYTGRAGSFGFPPPDSSPSIHSTSPLPRSTKRSRSVQRGGYLKSTEDGGGRA